MTVTSDFYLLFVCVMLYYGVRCAAVCCVVMCCAVLCCAVLSLDELGGSGDGAEQF
jgi:hypothetical protein